MGSENQPNTYAIRLDCDSKNECDAKNGLDLVHELDMDLFDAPKQYTPSRVLHLK